jgi:hypothetical protein
MAEKMNRFGAVDDDEHHEGAEPREAREGDPGAAAEQEDAYPHAPTTPAERKEGSTG